MDYVGYLASFAMGVILGIMGGGGSILTVPILVYLFGLTATEATSDSLFVVGTTALIGSFGFLRRREADLGTVLSFGIPSLLGVHLARAFLVPSLPNRIAMTATSFVEKDVVIMVAFAILMIAASVSMLIAKKERTKKDLAPSSKLIRLGLLGVIVGAIAGFVGAGGGFLIIPSLVVVAGLPMRRAVGTSLTVIALQSFIGFVGDVTRGSSPNWSLLVSISLLSMTGIVIGSTLAGRIEERKLKVSFAYFVLVMGALILVEQMVSKGASS